MKNDEKKSESNKTWESKYFDYYSLGEYADEEGQTLALIDSGVSKFQTKKIKKAKSFTDNDFDNNGHGTMMCSLILGYNNEICGIAPKVDIISYNIVDENGKTEPDIMAEAIYGAIKDKVDVINISMGSYFDNSKVRNAVKMAYDNNILIVAAAGDYGSTQMLYPARYDECISVGAMDSIGSIWEGTDGADKCDIISPGVDVTTIGINREKYLTTGTSQATALISGYVVLLKNYAKKIDTYISVRDIKTILQKIQRKNISFKEGFSEIERIKKQKKLLN